MSLVQLNDNTFVIWTIIFIGVIWLASIAYLARIA